jgi:alpha,alpha-trehalose phosphorylase
VVAAETGHLELAYDYWGEAALTDLQNVHKDSGNGLHIASLAGGWTVAVAGFGGLRDHDGELAFAPRLPRQITRLRFRVLFRGRCLSVAIEPDRVTYRLRDGDPLDIRHHGRVVTVDHADLVLDVPAPPQVRPVTQPHGLAPHRRGSPDGD